MKSNLTFCCLIVALATVLSCRMREQPDRPIVALNHDDSQLGWALGPEQLNREGIRAHFAAISKGGLTHLLITPNAHNCSYPTKVWEPVWRKDPTAVSGEAPYWVNQMRILAEKDIDWVGEMVRLCREQGVSPWLSMRMNDLHGIGSGQAHSTSRFWREHPEFRRKTGKLKGWSEDPELAYDFTHREVREHALALAREMLEKWDVDGFECDWLRFAHHLPDEVEKNRSGCAALTEYMREIRRLADEIGRHRGKRILVSVRVATTPEMAMGLGTDAVDWARKGLVDWVSPCNFWNTTDFLIPFAEWKAVLGSVNPNVRLVGGLDFAGVARDGWCPQGITEAEFCGYLDRMQAAGVHDLETFNLFRCTGDAVSRFIQEDGMAHSAAWLRLRDRAYPVTWHDAVPCGCSTGKILPVKVSEGGTFKVNVGHVGSAVSAFVLLAFDDAVPVALKGRVKLNGAPATAAVEVPLKEWMPSFDQAKASCRVTFPVAAARDGDNEISVSGGDGTGNLLTVELLLKAGE